MGAKDYGTVLEWKRALQGYHGTNNVMSEAQMKELSDKMDEMISLMKANQKPIWIRLIVDGVGIVAIIGACLYTGRQLNKIESLESNSAKYVTSEVVNLRFDNLDKQVGKVEQSVEKIEGSQSAIQTSLSKIEGKLGIK